jgi:hypothetical protein
MRRSHLNVTSNPNFCVAVGRKNSLKRIIALLILFLGPAPLAFAVVGDAWDYVKQSQIGVDYSNSIDRVILSYEMDEGDYVPSSCVRLNDGLSKRCSVTMLGGASNGWGVFLQAPFKKQGLFYLDWDVSFGARFLSGELQGRDRNLQSLPLTDASFSLLAAIVKPYVQFGITPEGYPDLLISLGPALQAAIGTVSVNGQSEVVAVGTSSVSGPLSLIQGFFAIEAVIYRFGDGAFSLMASSDTTGHGQGTQIYPNTVDGMADFKGNFRRDVGGLAFGFGLKLVTPWP